MFEIKHQLTPLFSFSNLCIFTTTPHPQPTAVFGMRSAHPVPRHCVSFCTAPKGRLRSALPGVITGEVITSEHGPINRLSAQAKMVLCTGRSNC